VDEQTVVELGSVEARAWTVYCNMIVYGSVILDTVASSVMSSSASNTHASREREREAEPERSVEGKEKCDRTHARTSRKKQ